MFKKFSFFLFLSLVTTLSAIDIVIKPGWNLIGTKSQINNFSDILKKVNIIYAYDKGNWKVASLKFPDLQFTKLDILKEGEGFWVLVKKETSSSYIPKDLTNAQAIRFLNKATFGATQESIESLKSMGVEAWINKQFLIPSVENIYLRKTIDLAKQSEPLANPHTVEEYLEDNDKVFNKEKASFKSPRYRLTSWFDTVLLEEDQLRHKVTYALSQIIVESDFEPIFTRRGEALARYFDILYHNAFGQYENLLNDISHSASMSLYLTYNGNKKAHLNDANVTIYPDENYAREIMQLFSIGLNEINLYGTSKKDSNGNLIPSYSQEDVNNLARVFTGWDNKRSGAGDDNRWDKFGVVGFTRGDFTHPMEFTEEYHDFGEKHVLGQTIPANLSGEEDIKKQLVLL